MTHGIPAKITLCDLKVKQHFYLFFIGRTDELSAHLYLCDVFILSTVVFSGHWWLDSERQLPVNRETLRVLLPGAAAALFEREAWKENTIQVRRRERKRVRETSSLIQLDAVVTSPS